MDIKHSRQCLRYALYPMIRDRSLVHRPNLQGSTSFLVGFMIHWKCPHVHTPLLCYSLRRMSYLVTFQDYLPILIRLKLVSANMVDWLQEEIISNTVSSLPSQQTPWDLSTSSLQSWISFTVTSHSRTR